MPIIDQSYQAWPFILMSLLLGSIAVSLAHTNSAIGYSRPLFFSWVAFLTVSLISAGYSIAPSYGILGFMYYLSGFLATVLGVVYARSRSRPGELVVGLLIAAFCLSLLAVVDTFFSLPDIFPRGLTLFRLQIGHNMSSAWTIFALPLLLVYRPATRWGRACFLLGAGVIIAAFILSVGRGAFLGAIVAGAYYFISTSDVKKIRIVQLSLLSLILYLFLLFQPAFLATLYPDASWGQKIREGRLARFLYKPLHLESRITYWRVAFQAISQRPLGYGPGTYRVVNARLREGVSGSTLFSHNAYLEAAVETGIIGGALFTALVIASLYMAQQKNENDPVRQALFSGALGSAVATLFGFDWVFPSIFLLFWFILGYLFAQPGPSLITRAGRWMALLAAGGGVVVMGWGIVVGGIALGQAVLPRLPAAVQQQFLIFSLPFGARVHPSLSTQYLFTALQYLSTQELARAMPQLVQQVSYDNTILLHAAAWYRTQQQYDQEIMALKQARINDPLNMTIFDQLWQRLDDLGQQEKRLLLEDDVLNQLGRGRFRQDSGWQQSVQFRLLRIAQKRLRSGKVESGFNIYRLLLEQVDYREQLYRQIIRDSQVVIAEKEKGVESDIANEILTNLVALR